LVILGNSLVDVGGLVHAVHGVFDVIAHSIKPPALRRWQSSGLKSPVAAVGFVID
jgi:hypothetical protein